MTRERIAEAVGRYFASFAAKDVDGRLQLFADDAWFEDPAGQLVASNRDGLRAFWVDLIPSDWDVRFTLERVAVVGDEAIGTATMRLCAGSRTPVDVLVNCHFVFDADGRIRQYRAFFDAESITDTRRELRGVTSGRVVAVVGNPNPGSRTLAIADLVARKVGALAAVDAAPRVIDVVECGPNLLEWGDPSVAVLKAEVLDADAVVVASPTYKAAYTGLLKLFLDQFDAGELHGIPTVAVMTGGSLAHALAVDVHLVPVLTEIGASCPTRGLYLWGPELDAPEEPVERWFERAGPPLRRALSAGPA